MFALASLLFLVSVASYGGTVSDNKVTREPGMYGPGFGLAIFSRSRVLRGFARIPSCFDALCANVTSSVRGNVLHGGVVAVPEGNR
jgi:hypothetical protein